jgi:glutathione S-transferase
VAVLRAKLRGAQYRHGAVLALDRPRRRAAELLTARLEAGRAALETLERHLTGRRFLVDDRYTVADVSLFAYVHVAHEAGIDMSGYPAVRAWLDEVRRTDRFVDDLDSYLPNARAGSGGRSVHG